MNETPAFVSQTPSIDTLVSALEGWSSVRNQLRRSSVPRAGMSHRDARNARRERLDLLHQVRGLEATIWANTTLSDEQWDTAVQILNEEDRQHADAIRHYRAEVSYTPDSATGYPYARNWFVPMAFWARYPELPADPSMPDFDAAPGSEDHEGDETQGAEARAQMTPSELFLSAVRAQFQQFNENLKELKHEFQGDLLHVNINTAGPISADAVGERAPTSWIRSDWSPQEEQRLQLHHSGPGLLSGLLAVRIEAKSYEQLAAVSAILADVLDRFQDPEEDDGQPMPCYLGMPMPLTEALSEADLHRWHLWSDMVHTSDLHPMATRRRVIFQVARNDKGVPTMATGRAQDLTANHTVVAEAFATLGLEGDYERWWEALASWAQVRNPDIEWSVHQITEANLRRLPSDWLHEGRPEGTRLH